MWNLKYDTKTLSMKQKQTHKENRFGTDKGEEEVGEINWEFGISRCKLINKILLYNTGNYSQYPVINYMEKNMKKNVCIYIHAAAALLQSCPTVQPHRWQPTRLPRLWGSPSKNTGVGCHFLLQCMKVKSENEVVQLRPTLFFFFNL